MRGQHWLSHPTGDTRTEECVSGLNGRPGTSVAPQGARRFESSLFLQGNMKKLIALLFLTGCATTMWPDVVDPESGALAQGSRAWLSQNTCAPGTDSGQCIKAVDGPFILTELKMSRACQHAIKASINDSFVAETLSPRWSVSGDVQNVEIIINAGESLYFGTDGYNNVVDSNRCYVAWWGRRP